jgi:hypothetical protein
MRPSLSLAGPTARRRCSARCAGVQMRQKVWLRRVPPAILNRWSRNTSPGRRHSAEDPALVPWFPCSQRPDAAARCGGCGFGKHENAKIAQFRLTKCCVYRITYIEKVCPAPARLESEAATMKQFLKRLMLGVVTLAMFCCVTPLAFADNPNYYTIYLERQGGIGTPLPPSSRLRLPHQNFGRHGGLPDFQTAHPHHGRLPLRWLVYGSCGRR